MRWLHILFVATFVIITIYIWSYLRFPQHVTVLQTTLRDFNFDMLREKQPLVIQDHVVEFQDLQKRWFGPNFTRAYASPSSHNVWYRNVAKYLVFCAAEEGDIYVYPAGKKMIRTEDGAFVPDPQEALLAIHVQPKQVLILPYRWHYLLSIPCDVLEIHDLITLVVK